MARQGLGDILDKVRQLEREVDRHDLQEWPDIGGGAIFTEEEPLHVSGQQVYDLSYNPNPVESLELERDGVGQVQEVIFSGRKQAYTLSGNRVTLALPLIEGEFLYARYRR